MPPAMSFLSPAHTLYISNPTTHPTQHTHTHGKCLCQCLACLPLSLFLTLVLMCLNCRGHLGNRNDPFQLHLPVPRKLPSSRIELMGAISYRLGRELGAEGRETKLFFPFLCAKGSFSSIKSRFSVAPAPAPCAHSGSLSHWVTPIITQTLAFSLQLRMVMVPCGC